MSEVTEGQSNRFNISRDFYGSKLVFHDSLTTTSESKGDEESITVDVELLNTICMQVDYYFSSDNLTRDTFLREQFDNSNSVPLSLIAGVYQ